MIFTQIESGIIFLPLSADLIVIPVKANLSSVRLIIHCFIEFCILMHLAATIVFSK